MSDRQPTPGDLLPLTHLSFLILLVLAREEMHGYAIIKEIQNQWGRTFNPGTGTFYSALRRMKGELLIGEADSSSDRPEEDGRRRYYSITDLGRRVLQAEARRLEQLVSETMSLQFLPEEST